MPRRRSHSAPYPTSIRLPLPLLRRLEKQAAREDRYLSVYIVRVLEQAMDRLDRPLPTFLTQDDVDG